MHMFFLLKEFIRGLYEKLGDWMPLNPMPLRSMSRYFGILEDKKCFSDIFKASVHGLVGPVSPRRLASLSVKILSFASQRLTPLDFSQLCDAFQMLAGDDGWRCDARKQPSSSCTCRDGNKRGVTADDIGQQFAHACRHHPEMLGLLCSILPAEISQTKALRESNESLRAGESAYISHATRNYFIDCVSQDFFEHVFICLYGLKPAPLSVQTNIFPCSNPLSHLISLCV